MSYRHSDKELPLDYETCGDCGFDHEYEYAEAADWHTANPGSYSRETPVVIEKVHGSDLKRAVIVERLMVREQLVQALVSRNGHESYSRDLVAKIERREAFLWILYPDYMHDLAARLTSIG